MARINLTIALTTALMFSSVVVPSAQAEEYPACTISGTSASETLNGTNGEDVICTGGGDDIINGLAGNDIIVVEGPGVLVIDGGDGNDTIDASKGTSATITDSKGINTILGTQGVDTIYGGAGETKIESFSGNDLIYGGSGVDRVKAGLGDDVVLGGAGDDWLEGGEGTDSLDGQVGKDTLFGDDGDDSLTAAGPGYEGLSGGNGNDVLTFTGSTPGGMSGGDGDDILDATLGTGGTFWGGPGNDLIRATPGDDTIGGGEGADQIYAYDGNDTINRNEQATVESDLIYAGSGNDIIGGGQGVDVIYGEDGNDTTEGSPGDDTVYGGNGDDKLSEFSGADTIYGGAGNDRLDGGDGDDVLNGEAGNDTIFGQFGNDTILGGLGDDLLGGSEGTDSIDGGEGVNYCDFQAGEQKLASCIHDDSAPDYSVTRTLNQVDIGSADVTMNLTFTATDLVGIKSLTYSCGQSGATLDVPGQTYRDHERWPTSIGFQLDPKNISITLPMTIRKESLAGALICESYAIDILNNKVNTRTESLTVFKTPAGQPNAPADLRFLASSPTGGKLVWNVPTQKGTPALTSYVVQSSLNGVDWRNVSTSRITLNEVDLTGLTANTQYWFRVRGDNGGVIGSTQFMNLPWTQISSKTPIAEIDIEPTDLTVSLVRSSSFKLSWTALSPALAAKITDYNVEISKDDGKTWLPGKFDVSVANSWTVRELLPATVYQVRVSASSKTGMSDYARAVVTTLAQPASAPQRLSDSNLTGTSVELNWEAPINLGGSALVDYKVESLIYGVTDWAPVSKEQSTATSFVVGNLAPGKIYQFRVRAITAAGDGTPSAFIYVTTPGASGPNAPLSLMVSSITSTSAKITWSRVTSTQKVSGYVVELSTDGTKWSTISSSTTSNASSISKLSPGTNYQIRVAAINSAGRGAFAFEAFSTLSTIPGAPSSLSTSNVNETSFTLKWNAPTSNGGAAITDYVVEINGGGYAWSSVSHDITGNTSMTISGLNFGSKYSVRVKAVNAVGVSKVSSTLNVTTLATTPGVVSGLAKKSVTATGAVISWVAPSNGGAKISDYKVEYSTDGGNTWLAVSKTASTSTSLTLKNLKTKTSYLFRVSAKNSVGYSAPSSNLIAVTP
jgi:Ca2+-binding RTX toxin-like protein